MTDRSQLKKLAAWLLPLCALAAWQLSVILRLLPPSQSASPLGIAIRLAKLLAAGYLPLQAGYSCMRLAVGIALGSALGIASGVLLAEVRLADRLISPTLKFVAPVPVVVWIPFVIMCFGSGEGFKITIVAICAYFLFHIQTFQAVRLIERHFVELAEVYQKSYFQRLIGIVIPSATPALFLALRISLAIAWIALFVAEYSSADLKTGGLGWFIADARSMGRIEDEFAGVMLLALIGTAFDGAASWSSRRRLVWADTAENRLAGERP